MVIEEYYNIELMNISYWTRLLIMKVRGLFLTFIICVY